MTPSNFLLANQSLSFQIGLPNKKARVTFIGLCSEYQNNSQKFVFSILNVAKEGAARV